MKQTRIIMSGNHPRLILDGIKTMTRRVIIPQPPRHWSIPPARFYQGYFCEWGCKIDEDSIKCPYGQAGDRLIIIEAWATENQYNHLKPSEVPRTAKIWYLADEYYNPQIMGKVRSARFMCNWMSRARPEITEVRAERLQEISDEDIEKEGITGWVLAPGEPVLSGNKAHFIDLWDSLNAKRDYGWDTNCWVFPISFKEMKHE